MFNRNKALIFIKKAKKKHGGKKYGYDRVDYVDCKTHVVITCKTHGDFKMRPTDHLRRAGGCSKCQYQKRFIKSAIKKHKGRYGYNDVVYNGKLERVIINCPTHGNFTQRPESHLKGKGCSKCGKTYMDQELFIKQSSERHGGFFNYSKTIYSGSRDKVIVTCPNHGDFNIEPADHKRGTGCARCCASKGELMVADILSSMYIKFDEQKRFKSCTYRSQLAFDFYLPEYGVCIEWQGEQHYRPVDVWGGDDSFELNKVRDQAKRDWCDANDITLLEIKYNMINKPNKVRGLIWKIIKKK